MTEASRNGSSMESKCLATCDKRSWSFGFAVPMNFCMAEFQLFPACTKQWWKMKVSYRCDQRKAFLFMPKQQNSLQIVRI